MTNTDTAADFTGILRSEHLDGPKGDDRVYCEVREYENGVLVDNYVSVWRATA